jgi:hypothetical protein
MLRPGQLFVHNCSTQANRLGIDKMTNQVLYCAIITLLLLLLLRYYKPIMLLLHCLRSCLLQLTQLQAKLLFTADLQLLALSVARSVSSSSNI